MPADDVSKVPEWCREAWVEADDVPDDVPDRDEKCAAIIARHAPEVGEDAVVLANDARHTHERDPDDDRACFRCGLDLTSPVHFRVGEARGSRDIRARCRAAARILSSPPAVVVSREALERLRDAFNKVEARARVEALAVELGADEEDMAGPTEDHHALIEACREIAALLGADGEG